MDTRFFALLLFFVLASPLTRQAAAAELQPVKFKKLLYSAYFNWEKSPMQIQLGTLDRPMEAGRSNMAAVLISGKSVQAICQRSLKAEQLAAWAGNDDAITMTCTGAAFAPLSTTVTLFIADTLPKPVLRFGTWLQGYREVTLTHEPVKPAPLLAKR
jgi:hypothetical protein